MTPATTLRDRLTGLAADHGWPAVLSEAERLLDAEAADVLLSAGSSLMLW